MQFSSFRRSPHVSETLSHNHHTGVVYVVLLVHTYLAYSYLLHWGLTGCFETLWYNYNMPHRHKPVCAATAGAVMCDAAVRERAGASAVRRPPFRGPGPCRRGRWSCLVRGRALCARVSDRGQTRTHLDVCVVLTR